MFRGSQTLRHLGRYAFFGIHVKRVGRCAEVRVSIYVSVRMATTAYSASTCVLYVVLRIRDRREFYNARSTSTVMRFSSLLQYKGRVYYYVVSGQRVIRRPYGVDSTLGRVVGVLLATCYVCIYKYMTYKGARQGTVALRGLRNIRGLLVCAVAAASIYDYLYSLGTSDQGRIFRARRFLARFFIGGDSIYRKGRLTIQVRLASLGRVLFTCR